MFVFAIYSVWVKKMGFPVLVLAGMYLGQNF